MKSLVYIIYTTMDITSLRDKRGWGLLLYYLLLTFAFPYILVHHESYRRYRATLPRTICGKLQLSR